MTHVTLFSSTIGDGPARLTVAVTQNFDSADAFAVALGNDAWPLATQDAERLAAAGRRIERCFDCRAQRNEPVEEAAYFRRQLGNANGRAVTFELGIDAGGPVAAVYLEWNGRRIIDSTGRLLKALAILAEATATIRQAEASRRVQNLQLDLKNYRSPLAWDGRTPYDP
jgi:hypothetical protein